MARVIGDFTPARLFANGEVGAWYDPSDSTTLFQDTAGKTPAGVGDPVGLMLDKSQGLVLGPELVTNGDFSDGDAGWIPNLGGGSGWVISGGVATFTGTLNGNIATASQIVMSGISYEVSFDVVRGSGITLSPYLVSQAGPLAGAIFSNIGIGTYKAVLAAPSNGGLVIRRQGGTDFDIDNISVKELPGNHATQSTSNARPTLQEDGNGNRYLSFDGLDDFLTAGDVFDLGASEGILLAAAFTGGGATNTAVMGKSYTGADLGRYFLAIKDLGAFYYDGTLRNVAYTFTTGQSFIAVQTIERPGNNELRVNGVSQGIVALTDASSFNTSFEFRIGYYPSAYAYHSGAFYGGVVVNEILLPISDITNIERYLASKSGVTL